MASRTPAELAVLKGREGFLVKFEYTQDRLRHEIVVLQGRIEDMQRECDKQRTATMVAEIILCVVAFAAGYAAGVLL